MLSEDAVTQSLFLGLPQGGGGLKLPETTKTVGRSGRLLCSALYTGAMCERVRKLPACISGPFNDTWLTLHKGGALMDTLWGDRELVAEPPTAAKRPAIAVTEDGTLSPSATRQIVSDALPSTRAAACDPQDVASVGRLRKHADADRVGVALELVRARAKAVSKFPQQAQTILADVSGVEQATSLAAGVRSLAYPALVAASFWLGGVAHDTSRARL